MFDERRLKILRAAFLFFVGTMMLRMSWLRWPDVLEDFGREVYIPWRLAGGDVLYRDIHYPGGPFSPFLNKFLFSAFGDSVLVVEAFNLVVIAVIAYLVYRLLARGGDHLASLASATVFLAVFAFARYGPEGGFNFMAPRSHELTHGTLLAFASFFYLRLYLEKGEPLYAGVVGLMAGLALLTRTETALGVPLASASGLVLAFVFVRPPAARLVRLAGLFLAGLLTPLAVFTVQLSGGAGPWGALGKVLQPVAALLAEGTGQGLFLQDTAVAEGSPSGFIPMLRAAAWYLVFVLPLAVNHVMGRTRLRPYGGYVSFAVFAAALLLLRDVIPWFELWRPLPLFAAAVSTGLVVALAARRNDTDASARLIPVFSWSVFALVMLFGSTGNVRVEGYGFALAMPAAVLTVHALVGWAPLGVERLSGYSGAFRAAAFAFVIAMAVWHAGASARVYSTMTLRVTGARTGDVVVGFDPRVRPEGQAVGMVIAELERIAAPDDTVAVLPEGTMVNYLARRENPTGYLSFLPGAALINESRVVDAFIADPPDFIILAHRDTSGYGPRFFGRDYGRDLFGFVYRNYEPVYRAGATPLRTDEFGMMILRRRDQPPARAAGSPR